jgi:hypothetical protein
MSDLKQAAQQALLEMGANIYNMDVHHDDYFEAMEALRAALAQQAEPVQEWVPLTDEQIEDLALNGTDSELRRRQFARAIEAALKEKNHG